jgi:hypothetical protein
MQNNKLSKREAYRYADQQLCTMQRSLSVTDNLDIRILHRICQLSVRFIRVGIDFDRYNNIFRSNYNACIKIAINYAFARGTLFVYP